MARLTLDAVILQSVLGVGEVVEVPALAKRAFGQSTPVSIMRTQRAAAILSSWRFVRATPSSRAREVCSLENPLAPGIQLWACLTRMILERLNTEA